jgi:hypothetical protein
MMAAVQMLSVLVTMSGTTPLVLLYAIADSVKSLIAYGKCEQTNLPGYTELEYIESTGTQYIDNVYTLQSNIYNIEITAETSVTGRELCVCSLLGAGTALIELAWSSTQGRIFSYQTTAGGSLGYNNLANIYNNKTFINIWQDSTKRYLKVNNEAAISDNNALSMPTSNAVKLLGMNSAVYNFVGKLYSCKITDNNVLVRNLIPVRRNSDNAVGMYDTVSGTFFINQGAGVFTGGAEKAPTPDNPISIWCNNGVVKVSPNLFNKNQTYISGFVNTASGKLSEPSTSGQKSFCISCQPNTTYVLSGMAANSGWGSFTSNAIGSYATNFTTGNGTITTGANDKYLIGMAYAERDAYDYRDTLQVEEGLTATTYMPYGQIYVDGTTETIETHGKNLFNPDYNAYSKNNVYAYMNGVVSNGSEARFTITDRDTSVNVSGCYVGFVKDDLSIWGTTPIVYKWAVSS